jgi:hypothetical protein
MNVKKYSFVVGDGEINDIKVSGSDVSAADYYRMIVLTPSPNLM